MNTDKTLDFNSAYDIVKSGNVVAFISAFNENAVNLTEKNKSGYSLIDAAAESNSVKMLKTVFELLPETSEKALKAKENMMEHALTHIIYPKKSAKFKLSDLKTGKEMRTSFTELYREITAKHTDAFLTEVRKPSRKRKPKI